MQGGEWALQGYDPHAKVHAGTHPSHRWMSQACLAQAVVWPQGAGVAQDCVASDWAPEGLLVEGQVARLAVPVPGGAGGVHRAHVSQWPVLLA